MDGSASLIAGCHTAASTGVSDLAVLHRSARQARHFPSRGGYASEHYDSTGKSFVGPGAALGFWPGSQRMARFDSEATKQLALELARQVDRTIKLKGMELQPIYLA